MNVEIQGPLARPQERNLSDKVVNQEVESLVRDAQAGNAEAFARLCVSYAERVFSHIFFQTGDEDAAEVLPAKVFLEAWNTLPCCEPGRPPFDVWLYLIARKAVVERNPSGDGRVKEIMSPEDRGLREYDAVRPGSNA
jgi:RNA polymerase sigma-70 factor (ECF subfamily)